MPISNPINQSSVNPPHNVTCRMSDFADTRSVGTPDSDAQDSGITEDSGPGLPADDGATPGPRRDTESRGTRSRLAMMDRWWDGWQAIRHSDVTYGARGLISV